MEIDPYCQRQNCSPLNVLSSVYRFRSSAKKGGGYNYITPCRAGLSATAELSCSELLPAKKYFDTAVGKGILSVHYQIRGKGAES